MFYNIYIIFDFQGCRARELILFYQTQFYSCTKHTCIFEYLILKLYTYSYIIMKVNTIMLFLYYRPDITSECHSKINSNCEQVLTDDIITATIIGGAASTAAQIPAGGDDYEASLDCGTVIDTEDCSKDDDVVLNRDGDEGERFSFYSMSSTENDDEGDSEITNVTRGGDDVKDTIKQDKNCSGLNSTGVTLETTTSPPPPPPDVIMHHNSNDNATKRKGSRRSRRKRRSFNAVSESATGIISDNHMKNVHITPPDVTDVGDDEENDEEEASNLCCNHDLARKDSTSITLSNTNSDNDRDDNTADAADNNPNDGDQSSTEVLQSQQVNV